jgi:3-oxoacyl-[acyl-carrier-protein] synthase-3
MITSLDALTDHLLRRLEMVRRTLGYDADTPAGPDDRFADLIDSMGFVEFLAVLAADCGTTATVIEESAGRRFGTVAELGRALLAAGVLPCGEAPAPRHEAQPAVAERSEKATCWLAATAVHLPRTVQPASVLDELLQRPAGWLERHAGIGQRRLWGDEDPLAGAVVAGRDCLERAGLLLEDVGVLLVTSEAPPRLAGLAAAVHHGLGLRPETAALEVGGACTGFLSALWLARRLAADAGGVLIVSVEAPSRFLKVEPGAAGETAALLGDGAAGCLVCAEPPGPEAVPVGEVLLGCDGAGAGLLRVLPAAAGMCEVQMDGSALASRAVRAMADTVTTLTGRYHLSPLDLAGVVAHGGNGRLPGLLARQLGLPPERVWSETPRTGNLGSASLPVAWAARQGASTGVVAWTAVGAGLTWGAALSGKAEGMPQPAWGSLSWARHSGSKPQILTG